MKKAFERILIVMFENQGGQDLFYCVRGYRSGAST